MSDFINQEREMISESFMKRIDSLYFSPSERASVVWKLINDERLRRQKANLKAKPEHHKEIPTDWDLLCFAVEFAGAQAIALQNDELLGVCVELSRWLYSIHYSNTTRLYGGPEKEPEPAGEEQAGPQAPQDAPGTPPQEPPAP